MEGAIITSNLETSIPCKFPTNLIKAKPPHCRRIDQPHKPVKGFFFPILWWMTKLHICASCVCTCSFAHHLKKKLLKIFRFSNLKHFSSYFLFFFMVLKWLSVNQSIMWKENLMYCHIFWILNLSDKPQETHKSRVLCFAFCSLLWESRVNYRDMNRIYMQNQTHNSLKNEMANATWKRGVWGGRGVGGSKSLRRRK